MWGAVIKSLAPLTKGCMFALIPLGNWVLGIKSIEHEWSRDCVAFEEIVLLAVCKLSNRGRQRSVLSGSWEVVCASMLLNEAITVISQQCAL